jgi:hypothetical protein
VPLLQKPVAAAALDAALGPAAALSVAA